MTPGKGNTLLADLLAETETAEAIRESNANSDGKKAASQANTLLTTLEKMDVEEKVRETLTEMVGRFTEVETQAFDKTAGALLASIAQAELAKPEEYQLTGFDAVKAEELIGRWKKATGGRGSGSTLSENAKPPVPIKVTFTFPDSHTETIQHGSSWSSVSNEITQRAKALDGFEGKGYKRPEDAAQAWKAAVATIREGGSGGVVTVPTKAGNLIAEVEAVR